MRVLLRGLAEQRFRLLEVLLLERLDAQAAAHLRDVDPRQLLVTDPLRLARGVQLLEHRAAGRFDRLLQRGDRLRDVASVGVQVAQVEIALRPLTVQLVGGLEHGDGLLVLLLVHQLDTPREPGHPPRFALAHDLFRVIGVHLHRLVERLVGLLQVPEARVRLTGDQPELRVLRVRGEALLQRVESVLIHLRPLGGVLPHQREADEFRRVLRVLRVLRLLLRECRGRHQQRGDQSEGEPAEPFHGTPPCVGTA